MYTGRATVFSTRYAGTVHGLALGLNHKTTWFSIWRVGIPGVFNTVLNRGPGKSFRTGIKGSCDAFPACLIMFADEVYSRDEFVHTVLYMKYIILSCNNSTLNHGRARFVQYFIQAGKSPPLHVSGCRLYLHAGCVRPYLHAGSGSEQHHQSCPRQLQPRKT